MTSKTERFEMRLDPSILDRVDAWRARERDLPSRAEAVRRLTERGLEQSASKEFRLSNPEKLMTWLLTEILRTQNGYEDPKAIELVREAIFGGHFWALQNEMQHVIHDHVDDPKNASFVIDVLDMWTFIERAYSEYSKEEKDRLEAEVGPWAKDPKFSGFDGNNEIEYLQIARVLIDKMGRFTSFKGRSLNSHSRTIGRYHRMVALFEPMRAKLIGRELSVDEVIELLKARDKKA